MSLAITDLGFAFGAKRALDGVSFAVPKGQFCALLGPNGAGKSTLFNLLTRLYTSAEGRIEIGSYDLATEPREALARMGVVFQQTTLDLDLTVAQNLGYFAALHGLSGAEARSRSQEVMSLLAITDRAQAKTRDLNGGHRRRLEIARALLHRPQLLLLDEPTVGLDAASRASITEHVHRLTQETGLTVLWATHLTDEIADTDQVVILHQGKILRQGSAQDITQGAALRDVFLQLTAPKAA
ncbi:MAG: ABC transporter ATP-binding protein [Mangrovicoccus sp.]